MKIVRRHRRAILVVLLLGALLAMTFSFLKRVGVDPLEPLRDEPAEPR
ncbi:MAG TPA: hypothetical protein RMH99_32875 [Sandaracinaceae bacterium LLY-WYZ-13_1]|nr:hypothetical protein [Sandaracinaceae bacterium LLY-WYZ-13_1]